MATGDKTIIASKDYVDTAVGNAVGALIDDSGVSHIFTWSSSKVSTELGEKQETLVSGTNIKTINGTSVLGVGDIVTLSLAQVQATALLF